MKKGKCQLCKRRKLDERDLDFIEHTGRCFKCDFKIHLEDMKEEHKRKMNTKDTFTKSDYKALNIRLGGLN